jgi:hypothetical protein
LRGLQVFQQTSWNDFDGPEVFQQTSWNGLDGPEVFQMNFWGMGCFYVCTTASTRNTDARHAKFCRYFSLLRSQT